MTKACPESNCGAKEGRGSQDARGIVLRAVALAALALGLGVGASLLVDTRHGGYLSVPGAAR